MLDSSKDSLKLEAMKRIITMVARGRDAAELFPAVVKNVVSKNIEIKKLVYVYLTRYAEEQQDLALLSISTFQRALKDPNQLIRASALRVLSSIRVPVIVPIMMLAIKDSSVDMSPFVRKTAAHAIPKLHGLDPEQKEELVDVIEKLLGDRTTLVVGSAVMAFEEVCPERIDLVHKNYRKLCNLLVDVEEWGQVVILNMLTRYARTQFVDPNPPGGTLDEIEREKKFYEDEFSSDDEEAKKRERQKVERPKMDQDHRLLLRSARPLLQSRNAAVVMATAQLYHHCAPKAEVQVVAKAMIRLLRSHREVQAIVLNCIASMTSGEGGGRTSMFEPFLRNFFVRASDPTHVKILKLEIITNMASAGNIGVILREFQSYITGADKVCVAATIQAIGRCAASIDEVTDTCLNGLVHLLSNKDESVVAESIVVVKKLLQTQSGDHKDIIVHMARLSDSIAVPDAKAAILWVMGEYCQRVPKIAPDVLRKAAKSFTSDTTQVKMQTLNLAAKLCLTNPEKTKQLAQYVFSLARYDQDYDLRDRVRLMKALVFPPAGRENDPLVSKARSIFLATKPAPVTESKFKDRDVYQLGSMSHFLNARASGYRDLPDFPLEAPDPSLRNVEPPPPPPKVATQWSKRLDAIDRGAYAGKEGGDDDGGSKEGKKKGFYSESEDSSDSSSSSSDSESESSTDSGSESDSNESVEERTRKRSSTPKEQQANGAKPKRQAEQNAKSAAKSDSVSESSSGSSDESSSEEEEKKPQRAIKKNTVKTAAPPQSNLDLLLDLSSDTAPAISPPSLTPSLGGFLTPTPGSGGTPGSEAPSTAVEVSPVHVPSERKELVNKMSSGGLQVLYRYTRTPHLYAKEMCNVELTLNNLGSDELTDVKVGAKRLSPGMAVHDFPAVPNILPGGNVNVSLGVNFNDTTQAAKFDLVASGRCHNVNLLPKVGEIVRAVSLPENAFNQEQSKLRGMNETSAEAELPSAHADEDSIKKRIYQAANVIQVPSTEEGVIKFAAQTLTSRSLALVRLTTDGTATKLTINCEKIVVGSMLAKELKEALEA